MVMILCHQSLLAQGGMFYFSHHNRDQNDNLIPFQPDTVYGQVHSNDYFYFTHPVRVFDFISTAKDSFIFGNGMTIDSLIMDREPVFNTGSPILPMRATSVRQNSTWINDGNGRYMTRIEMRGGDGIVTYQYELGGFKPPVHLYNLEDVEGITNIRVFQTPAWGGIFVNGQAEVFGEVMGNLTIGTQGDMWLVDNIWYHGARIENGRWSNDERHTNMPHMLGLVSERNIIIKNNVPNGRENGKASGDRRFDRHSITINAALAALNGSLKFEHTNEDYEAYQGPSPDERGTIHLKGALHQRHTSLFHNDNHEGTGYDLDFAFDYRIGERPPPFFPGDFPWCYSFIIGNGYRVGLIAGRCIVIGDANCRWFEVQSGSEILFRSHYSINIRGYTWIGGTTDEPVNIRWEDEYPGGLKAEINVYSPNSRYVLINNTVIEEGIDLSFDADSVIIDSCSFAGTVTVSGPKVRISNSTFKRGIKLNGWQDVLFERNLVLGEVRIDRNPRNCRIINNTVVNPGGNGVFLDSYRSLELNSNIIAYCRRGIVQDNWHDVDFRYNNVFGSERENYLDCEPGESSISVDPRFEDMENGNYRLASESRCIDAGDPELPPDPDGTRRDIGAFWRHSLQVEEKPVIPEGVYLTASPNPFNYRTTISFPVKKNADIKIGIFDLQGRELLSETINPAFGKSKYIIDGERLGGAGLYVVRLDTGYEQHCLKLVYLP